MMYLQRVYAILGVYYTGIQCEWCVYLLGDNGARWWW